MVTALCPFAFSLGGPVNTGHATIVTHPDGSKDVTVTVRYASGDAIGPELTVTRSFDPSGKEDTSKTRYTYNLDHLDEYGRELWYRAYGLSQEEAQRAAKEGNLQVTFTQEELTALANQAREVNAADRTPSFGLVQYLANAKTPEEVARVLATYSSSQYGVGQELLELAMEAEFQSGAPATPPGTLSVWEPSRVRSVLI